MDEHSVLPFLPLGPCSIWELRPCCLEPATEVFLGFVLPPILPLCYFLPLWLQRVPPSHSRSHQPPLFETTPNCLWQADIRQPRLCSAFLMIQPLPLPPNRKCSFFSLFFKFFILYTGRNWDFPEYFLLYSSLDPSLHLGTCICGVQFT